MLNRVEAYVKGTNILKADGVQICFTAAYTVKEKGRAEQMNRTFKTPSE